MLTFINQTGSIVYLSLADLEARFVCQACGKGGADVAAGLQLERGAGRDDGLSLTARPLDKLSWHHARKVEVFQVRQTSISPNFPLPIGLAANRGRGPRATISAPHNG